MVQTQRFSCTVIFFFAGKRTAIFMRPMKRPVSVRSSGVNPFGRESFFLHGHEYSRKLLSSVFAEGPVFALVFVPVSFFLLLTWSPRCSFLTQKKKYRCGSQKDFDNNEARSVVHGFVPLAKYMYLFLFDFLKCCEDLLSFFFFYIKSSLSTKTPTFTIMFKPRNYRRQS